MDFVRSKFGTNEPLPVEHFFPHFFGRFAVAQRTGQKSEEKSVQLAEVTSYKFHTLAAKYIIMDCSFNIVFGRIYKRMHVGLLNHFYVLRKKELASQTLPLKFCNLYCILVLPRTCATFESSFSKFLWFIKPTLKTSNGKEIAY